MPELPHPLFLVAGVQPGCEVPGLLPDRRLGVAGPLFYDPLLLRQLDQIALQIPRDRRDRHKPANPLLLSALPGAGNDRQIVVRHGRFPALGNRGKLTAQISLRLHPWQNRERRTAFFILHPF
jgi:hypothetical protein